MGEVDLKAMLGDINNALERVRAFVGEDILENPLVNTGVLRDVLAEYRSAKAKHGDMTLDGVGIDDLKRLTALMEEVGEVAETFSYDHKRQPHDLRKELIQVANVALTWASILPDTTPVVVDLHA